MEREGATSNASTGLRRRQFGANLDEQQNQQQLQQENRPHGASSSAAETNRSSKNLIEILLSPFINLLGDGTSEDPQEASRKFHESLRNKYGQHCPRFEHSSFRDAVTTARSASKFLLVFLYSEIHEDTDSFCSNTICTETISTFLNESDCIVSWAGSVQQAEGYSVSLTLGSGTFPYVALLTCVSRGVNIVEKMTGPVKPTTFLRRINEAVEKNSHIMAAARHIHVQREEAQFLREQQDREYQESLEADRLRDEEARLKEQEEINAKSLQEEEERRMEEEKQKRQEMIEVKRQRLGLPPTTKETSSKKTCLLKFHLHNGNRLERSFYRNDTLERVFDFIDIEFYQRQIPIVHYELATNFPKKIFGKKQLHLTLEEAKLVPQALVFVQDLDS